MRFPTENSKLNYQNLQLYSVYLLWLQESYDQIVVHDELSYLLVILKSYPLGRQENGLVPYYCVIINHYFTLHHTCGFESITEAQTKSSYKGWHLILPAIMASNTFYI